MPEHTGFAEAVILILTDRFGLTVMVIKFEVAGLLVIQSGSEEVRMQVTTSPFKGV